MPPTTRVMVLRAFPYSADGVHVEMLPAGAEASIRASLVHGLAAEGYVALAHVAVAAAAQPASIEAAPVVPPPAPPPIVRQDMSGRGRRGPPRK